MTFRIKRHSWKISVIGHTLVVVEMSTCTCVGSLGSSRALRDYRKRGPENPFQVDVPINELKD